MDNILYLDDYINLYNKNSHKLIVTKPYKKTLKNGFIIDKEKFIEKFNMILENHKLKNNFFSENIIVVINNMYNSQSKFLIKEVMEDLNYKKVTFINESNFLKINKNVIYINCNYEYFYFLYTGFEGNIQCNLYKNDLVNKNLIKYIIKLINKPNIILYGKNYKEIKNILEKSKIDYYIFEETENLIIKFLLNSKKM